MFKIIEGLADHVIGIEITGKLRAEDYENLLIPLVNEKLKNHKKLDLLCRIDGEWKGMEAGAAWQDLRLGLGNMGHWARMAVVTDIKWMENSINLFKIFWPGELRHFELDDYDKARDWVGEQQRATIQCSVDDKHGIMVLEPDQQQALSEDDFEYVSKVLNDYVKEHDNLKGILISTRKFPGWQGIGAMFSHMKFAGNAQKNVSRVAVVTNSVLGSFADHVVDHLIKADVRQFDYDQRDQAMEWLIS